ncbi:MAG: hypothetical protein AAGI30_09880 [Planctomycetota bacterium]
MEVIHGRRWCEGVEVAGDLVVARDGELVAPAIDVSGDLIVRGVVLGGSGRVDRLVLARGCVWSGDCTARTIVIDAGAEIRSGRLEVVDVELVRR